MHELFLEAYEQTQITYSIKQLNDFTAQNFG